MVKNKLGACMADGGITQQETPEQLMARMAAKYGAPTGATQQPQPQSTQQAPQQPPPKSNPLGIMSILKGRSAQIDKAVNGYASGGVIKDTADYWENDNAEFEKTNPNFGQRVLRGVNPLTGFGSAMGAMQTAARNGDVPGMAMAGISATPALGVLRAVPAAGAMKAAVAPSLGKSVAALTGGAVANAAADEYQKGKDQGFANGGIAGHVKFEGKGGPREDQIPVKVAGQKINVSDGEQALIIPAKTAANAHAMAAIKQIIADSNDGRQPDMGHGDSNFAEGGLLDDEARKMNYQAVTGVQAPAPTPQPAAQPDSGGWSLGKSGPGANLQVTTGDAARLPAPAVQQGIATMRNQLATPQAPAQVSQPSVGVPTTSEARPWYAGTSSADPRNGLEMERERRSQASNEGVLNDPVKSALKYGVIGQPKQNSAAQLSGSNYGNEGRSVPTEITKDSPGAVALINSDQPAAPNPMQQDMPLTTKDIVPGGYSDRGAGIIASRNKDGRLAVSNVGTEGVADMSKGVMDDSASAAARHAADLKSGSTVQQVYERMVRNRMTADANDPTITDPAVRQQAVQGLGIMGNPAENQLKQAQAQGIMAQTESGKMIDDIRKKALAGDPQALASYKALTQRGGADYKDRYITLPNRKTYNEMGQITGEESGGIFDAATGQPVSAPTGKQTAQQQEPSFASKADLQAAIKAGKVKPGQTVMTPNGPMVVK